MPPLIKISLPCPVPWSPGDAPPLPTGVIITHDMDPWECFPEQSKAVDDWLANNPEWKHKTQKGNNGMTIFYRDESHLCGVKCDVDLKMGRLTD